ncbi:MAG: hypothetical protein Kow0074_13730 [Candidatus Zixiibacteriota bacterium]
MERTIAKRWGLLVTGLVAVMLIAPAAQADHCGNRIIVQPKPDNDFRIWIWPDRGEGGDYLPGDNIRINVEVTRDCFLILYNIDTRGNLRILFPYDPWDDNFVAAGEIITFPRPWDIYEWTVDGPSGVEYVQAIASEFPIRPPDWPVYIRSVNHGGAVCPDPDLRDFRAGRDRMDYIRVVNRKITGRYWEWCATDLATFYVRPRYYRPVWHKPWPDVFYGEIYIGWPIGGRIYVDGIYVGVAPLWIPRRHAHGQHVIVCRDGGRVVRRQIVHYYPKREYKYTHVPGHRDVIIDRGMVKPGRRGGIEHFKIDVTPERRERVWWGHDSRVRVERRDRPDRDDHSRRSRRVIHERDNNDDWNDLSELYRRHGRSADNDDRWDDLDELDDRGGKQVVPKVSRRRIADVDRPVSVTNSAPAKVSSKPRLEARPARHTSEATRSSSVGNHTITTAKRSSGPGASVKRDKVEKTSKVKRSKSGDESKSRARATSGKRRK